VSDGSGHAAGGGRPARRRSKPAAFWLTAGKAGSTGAPDYREETASPAPSSIDGADAETGEDARPEELPARPDAAEGAAAAATGRVAAPPREPAETARPLQTDADGDGSHAAALPAGGNAPAVRPLSVPMTSRVEKLAHKI